MYEWETVYKSSSHKWTQDLYIRGIQLPVSRLVQDVDEATRTIYLRINSCSVKKPASTEQLQPTSALCIWIVYHIGSSEHSQTTSWNNYTNRRKTTWEAAEWHKAGYELLTFLWITRDVKDRNVSKTIFKVAMMENDCSMCMEDSEKKIEAFISIKWRLSRISLTISTSFLTEYRSSTANSDVHN